MLVLLPVGKGVEVERIGGMVMLELGELVRAGTLLVVDEMLAELVGREERGTTARITVAQPVGAVEKTNSMTSSKTQKVAAPLVKLPLTHVRVPTAAKVVVIEPTGLLAANGWKPLPLLVEICPSLLKSCPFTMKNASAKVGSVTTAPPAPM